MTTSNSLWRMGVVMLTLTFLAGAIGCGKSTQAPAKTDADLDAKLAEVVKSLQKEKEPYKGNLTPKKAAQITHEVSVQSLKEFPTGKNLPKDPKKLLDLNEKIRAQSDKIYAKHGTTMGEMMRYLSDLTPKQREAYNNHLTELFLAESKKKYGGQDAKPKTAPAAEAAPKKKK